MTAVSLLFRRARRALKTSAHRVPGAWTAAGLARTRSDDDDPQAERFLARHPEVQE
jgi:hypothetical protein